MKFIKKLFKNLTLAVSNRGMQFVMSVSFTLVSVVGMLFVGIFLTRAMEKQPRKWL